MNSLKRILNCLRFNKGKRKLVNNNVYEIPFNSEKTIIIKIPNIQNKAFKISKWFVKVGDFIQENQLICELESNSITIEFENINSGKLVSITNSKENLKPGDLICKVEQS